jgi:ketosteroid isomerase-like protein
MLLLSCSVPGNRTPEPKAGASSVEADTQEIKSLITKYTEAVGLADTNLASQVWSGSPDISFIHPLGHEHGWEQVKGFFEKTMGAAFSERKLTVRDVAVRVYGDSAWAEFYWNFAAKLRSNGAPVETAGRETQIYRRVGPNRWALVHVHYSGMPVTPPGRGF